MTPYKTPTESYKSPLERVYIEINRAIAESFRQGAIHGRSEVLRWLKAIVDATDDASRTYAIKAAERELKKWGV